MRRLIETSYAELPPEEQPFRRPHSYEAADASQLLRDSGMATPMPKPRATPITKPSPGERFAGPSTPEAIARPKPTVQVTAPARPTRPTMGGAVGRPGDRMRPRRRY